MTAPDTSPSCTHPELDAFVAFMEFILSLLAMSLSFCELFVDPDILYDIQQTRY